MDKKLFYVAIAFLPVLSLKLNYNINIGDLLIILLFFFILFKMVLKRTSIAFSQVHAIWLILAVLFVLSYLLSVINALDKGSAIIGSLQFAFTFIVLFFVIAEYVKTEYDFQTIAKILVFNSTFSVVYSVIIENIHALPNTSTHVGRHFSYLLSPAVFGLFICSTLPFTIYLFLNSRMQNRKTESYKYIVFFVVQLYGIFISGSRTGFVVLFIYIWMLCIFILKRKLKMNEFISVLSLFGLVFLYVLLSYKKIISYIYPFVFKFEPTIAKKLGTLMESSLWEIDSSRFYILETAFEYLNESPLLGSGFGNFYLVNDYKTVHSFLISTWVEGGVVAFFAMALMYIYFFTKLMRTRSVNVSIIYAVVSSNVLSFIYMMINPIYTFRIVWVPLLLLVTVLKISSKKKRDGIIEDIVHH